MERREDAEDEDECSDFGSSPLGRIDLESNGSAFAILLCSISLFCFLPSKAIGESPRG